jgi:hypothetical protein
VCCGCVFLLSTKLVYKFQEDTFYVWRTIRLARRRLEGLGGSLLFRENLLPLCVHERKANFAASTERKGCSFPSDLHKCLTNFRYLKQLALLLRRNKSKSNFRVITKRLRRCKKTFYLGRWRCRRIRPRSAGSDCCRKSP